MATLPELLAQAEIVRTAQNVDENTAQRIGKLYNDIIVYFSTNGGAGSIEDTLYADLLVLINNNKLIPGSSYRITDYTTTTAQANTTSAGHGFDVIVTALSTDELSEIASCVRKSDDTYFENADLEAWEIKYCINNDTSRFAWADTVSGKGVIYYMKDEWGNECPYDFKNIQYLKNSVLLYTFGGTTDNSLIGNSVGNSIKESTSSNKLSLNFNTFGTNCKLNTLGFNSNKNTFGDNCNSNKLGNNCLSNTFGNLCQFNTFATGCQANTFGNGCYSNAFNDYCYSNTFGINCNSNTFDINCQSNTFGDRCGSNTFGINCWYNTFGNDCQYNTFGNLCRYNNFYHGASGATKKDYIKYIVLEDGCRYNNVYSSIITNGSNYLQRIRIKGLEQTTPTNIQITLPTTNNNYEWVICYTSDGTLKQYYSGDITEEINKLLPLIYAGL